MSEDLFDRREIEMPMGIIVEKRPSSSRWISHTWRPVAVIPGAGPIDEWKLIGQDGDIERYHIATLPLQLHRKETEAYRIALTYAPPSVYVVLRKDDEDPESPEITAFRVTASPYEAQDYLDSGEDIVERVEMPEGLIAWVREFTERHHVEEVFKKRKRVPHLREEAQFGKRLDPVEQRFYDKSKLN